MISVKKTMIFVNRFANYWFRHLELQTYLQFVVSGGRTCQPGWHPVVTRNWPRKSISSLVEAGGQIFQVRRQTMDYQPAEYSSSWMSRPMCQPHGSRHAQCHNVFQRGDKAQVHMPLPCVCLFGTNPGTCWKQKKHNPGINNLHVGNNTGINACGKKKQ